MKNLKESTINIIVFDVGHGDSILIYFPPNNSEEEKWGIIDCNKYPQERMPKILNFLIENNINQIEFILLTHPHFDHFEGMEEILKEYLKQGKIIRNFFHYGFQRSHLNRTGSHRGKKKLGEIFKLILEHKKKNGLSISPNPLPTFQQFNINDATIIPVSPSNEDVFEYNSNDSENINKLSVILAIVFKGKFFLLCGDGEKKNIQRVLLKWKNSQWSSDVFDFIKVSHHASINGHCNELYENFTTNDFVSIISCGVRKNISQKDVLKFLSSKSVLYATNIRKDLLLKNPPEQIDLSFLTNLGFHKKSMQTTLNKVNLDEDYYINKYHGTCMFYLSDTGGIKVNPQYSLGPINQVQLAT